ncbi:MAG TPA: tetratricopeptide repeat protein [Chthoniobacterales bacterium]|nr:tetratricopeptide repeat protein [Chthoniobacterales bacterium]
MIIRRVRAILLQSLCLALSLVWLAQAIGQPYLIPNSAEAKSETEQLFEKANELYLKKDYDAALPLLDRCLLLKENALGRDDPQVAFVLDLIGGAYRDRGDPARALPYLQRSLAIKEKVFGKDSPELTLILSLLALTCQAEQLNTAAIDYFERCLVIQDKNPSRDYKNTSTYSLLDNLANLYRFQGNYEKALAALQRSQTIKEGLFGKESKEVANCIHKRALIYEDLGDYVKAQPLFELGLRIRQAHSSEDGEFAICLRDLAHFFHQRGDITNALALYQRAAAIVEKLPESDGATVAGILGSLAGLYRELGNFAAALDLYQRCVVILEKQQGPQQPSLASALGNLANLKADLGQYDEALALHKRSLAINERAYGKQSQQFAVCLNDMALVYGAGGDFAEQLALEEQALDIQEKLLGGNHPEVAAVLGNIGDVEIHLGNYVDAMKHLQRSLAIKESVFGRKSLDVATTLNNLAELFGILGDSKTDLSLSKETLAIAEKLLGAESPLAVTCLGNVGFAYRRQGQYSQAISCYSRSLAIAEKIYGREHPEVARLLNNIADVYQAMEDLAKAEDFYQRSLSINVKLLGEAHPKVVVSMNNLATLLYSSGKTAAAITTFLRVAQLQRANSTSLLSQLRGKNSFLFTDLMFYRVEMLHSACAEAAKKNLSVAKTGGAEQLALNKGLLEEIQATFAALEADPKTSTQTLREQYAAVQNQLAHFSERKLGPADRDVERRELQNELTQLETKLAERVGLVAQTIHERNLTLTDIARSLLSQSALVDFIQYRRYDFAAKTNEWKEQRYAAYLTFPLAGASTNVVVERVDFGEAAPINEAVELICKRMSTGQYRAKDLQPTFQRLSDLLYVPLAKHVTNVSHLIICPDGQLSRLPFEMLPVGNKFLVEEKTISYVTSGREVVRLANSKSNVRSSKSLVMGNPDFDLDLKSLPVGRVTRVPNSNEEARGKSGTPVTRPSENGLAVTRSLSRDYSGLKFPPLPGAEAEARSVAKLLGGDGVLRLGAEAREAELKSVQSPRVLDLATHGFFLSDQEFSHTTSGSKDLVAGLGARQGVSTTKTDWENPLVRCGIALAGANRARQITNAGAEDGLLTGLEASLLNLQGTELVILSACDSGAGEVKIGEGVMSLRHAFRIAGAETVLASHWKVSDKATSLLMTEFMRRWRAGESRANAWREAQLTLLRSKDFSNPFFWSAFTLTGQW